MRHAIADALGAMVIMAAPVLFQFLALGAGFVGE